MHFSLRALSAPWSALLIDWLYVSWYALKAPFLLYFIWVAKSEQRMHFLTCYLLLWMTGGAFAIAFPSLGPVYTNSELFELLNTPTAHKLQMMLWQHYHQLLADPTSYKIYIYEGIAAFPSLHVAMAVLFTLAVKKYRWAFRLMAFYSLSIQIGSVLLGWHYAVDGYFGALLAIGIFYATRQFGLSSKGKAARVLSWQIKTMTNKDYNQGFDKIENQGFRMIESTFRNQKMGLPSWIRPSDFVLIIAILVGLVIWVTTGIPVLPIRPWMVNNFLFIAKL